MTHAAKVIPFEEELKPELYRGIQVLHLHQGDPIPTPRAPIRYAVRIGPDLARYLLEFNHPNNRKRKPTAIAKYVRDMASGYWQLTPESLVFSTVPQLEDGQNRLWAVIESGCTVWMMVDFGWPEDTIRVINRASSRTNADAFKVVGYGAKGDIPAAITVIEQYRATVGTPLLWGKRLLTASEATERYETDPDGWIAAGQHGRRAYDSTRGLGPTTWIAAFYLIAEAAGTERAVNFYDAIIDESGEPGSANRRLKSHYLRRRLTDTASGDRREPVENIIRAFNAWTTSKPVGFVRTGGAFILSGVRKP